MLKAVLLLLVLSQNPAGSAPEFGTVAGSITPPAQTRISEPIQVILLSPDYAALFASEAQKRLDTYWERYKPAFAQKKELFFEIQRMAYREALDYVMSRMQRDPRIHIADIVRVSGPDGKFEFKNLALGEYKIVATGKAGGQELFWQESVDVSNAIPQFVRLKSATP